MPAEFVHLHVHSYYSLLDGLSSPERLVLMAKEKGMNALALTDHGVMYGAIEFFQAAKKHGIKPIIGCEAYLCHGSRGAKNSRSDAQNSHVLLLAKNLAGYKNLMKLVTYAHLDGYYYRPRIDWDLIEKYHEGLIVTTACLAGPVSTHILNEDYKRANEVIDNFISVFGKENFYLEVQHHPAIPEQNIANEGIFKIAKERDIPVVATNDIHYAAHDDKEAHDALICVQTQTLVSDEERMRYVDDFSIRSPEEMAEAFKDHPEVLANTVELAEKCNLEIPLYQNLLPQYMLEGKKVDSVEFLRKLCFEGLEKRYTGEKKEEAKAQLEHELSVIHKMGFDDYFLIVWDFVKYAKNNKVMVGPGRGSAAGSIVSYCLDITTVDPLKYGLVFERFLNPERISMPDIDIDFADSRREEILGYVTEKYGQNNVAQIITFGTMAARAAIRDVGRVLGMGYGDVDKIAKLVPSRPGTKLADAIRETPDLQAAYNNNDEVKKLLNLSLKLEGVVRHASTHACAVVISEDNLTNHTPLQLATKDENAFITQYSMKPIEKIGLLKMDFLGLKNLTILENTVKLVRERHDSEFNLDEISFEDEKTFELLGKGETVGVFQLESAGMRRYLKELKPTHFEDIVAMISLYRPGPMEWISDYIAGKYGKKKVTYVHPILEPILSPTYGIIVYQEQILEIAKQFAGFSMGEADVLRRAIGKKIKKELDSQKEKFIQGAVENGIDKSIAVKVFGFVEPFANYGFNKSHAVSYAFISYQTAYLKAHYPLEFMAALLTADEGNSDRVMIEIQECREMGIDVLSPSVNESKHDFTPSGDKSIRFAFKAIKNIGDGPIEGILNAREDGPFKTIENFLERCDSDVLNRKTLESLAKSGAFEDLVERNTVLMNIDEILQFAKNSKTNADTNQIGLFGEMSDVEAIESKISLQEADPVSTPQKLAWEKEYLGIYLSEHPLDKYKDLLKRHTEVHAITEKHEGKTIQVAGVINAIKRINTKNGQLMLFVTIEDLSGSLEVIVFPSAYEKFKHLITDDALLSFKGRISFKDARDQNGNEPKLLVSQISILDEENLKKDAKKNVSEKTQEAPQKTIEKKKVSHCTYAQDENILYVHIPKYTDLQVTHKVKNLVQKNSGETSVVLVLHLNGEKNYLQLPEKVAVSSELVYDIESLINDHETK